MLKRIFSCLALVLVVAKYGDARAALGNISGVTCNPVAGSQNQVEYSRYGINNTSTSTAATVMCAIPLGMVVSATNTLSQVFVTVYDRNSSSDVSCTLYQLDTGGGILWSNPSPIVSSGNNAGSQELDMLPGVTGKIAFRTWMLMCTLPPRTASGDSHLTNIYFN
jgi:hypothetical protein